jgi:hypothetical protein
MPRELALQLGMLLPARLPALFQPEGEFVRHVIPMLWLILSLWPSYCLCSSGADRNENDIQELPGGKQCRIFVKYLMPSAMRS